MEWSSVLHGLLFFLPAYVANMSPVFVAKLIPRWNAPIDGGRVAKDGKRILGPGKTWRGLAGGAATGALTAVLVALIVPAFDDPGDGVFDGWDYGYKGSVVSGGPNQEPTAPCPPGETCAQGMLATNPDHPLWRIGLFGAILGAAALVGDAVKSYFKRRIGKDRGRPWVPFDQLDFVVFGLAAAFAFSFLLPPGWVVGALLGEWLVLGTIVLLTPALHFLANVIGYLLKLKQVPW